MKLMVDTLIDHLRHVCRQLPDPRNGSNTQYSLDDIAMSAFSVFFMQSPSFLDHQRKFQKASNRNACRSLFGVRKLPSDNHIRQTLDGIDPRRLDPAFDFVLRELQQKQALSQLFQPLPGRSLILLDGTRFHHSRKIKCRLCSSATKGGATSHFHSVLCAVIAAPGHNRVILRITMRLNADYETN